MRLILLLTLASACVTPKVLDGFYDLYVTPIRPEVVGDLHLTLSDWTSYVESAALIWNEALADLGCEPIFHVTSDPREAAYPVTLYATEAWPHTGRLQGELGHTFTGRVGDGHVDVRARERTDEPFYAVLHELGHALGVGHAERDPTAVMAPVLSLSATLTVSDLDMLRAASGCIR